ncbi:unnamed protein product [Brassicogethes aeneus]|uniref:poly(ADP-ribose) glycohydrolase n=1 Tax=Brassicogethes aeneus TaxID=1431903 RepID=A0A9P0BB59_BRAAE|nr:unnamed protein product [Brassicogethes aeneus]
MLQENMALVMLPCDLPWWDSVKKHLKKIASTKNTLEIIEAMQKIYEMCNVSLDPDDDLVDPDQFTGLLNFLENDVTNEERSNLMNRTLPNVVKHAILIKERKPKRGLHFSLQQQADCTELDYAFVTSLLANAFFSTFPKRTDKSHPTLQNFNFSNFFKNLADNPQKTKLRSVFHFFDWIEEGGRINGHITVQRQVMTSKEWLTIEDWLECSLPLCPLQIKHEGKLERSDIDSLQILFASAKIGGDVLRNGSNQESTHLATIPELIMVLLNIESLEDNEVLTVGRVRRVSRIKDPKNKAVLEKLDDAQPISVCCMDADDYKKLPISQYEEDNVLRELNKCLLAFQQKPHKTNDIPVQRDRQRRLSPIGESMGSNVSEGIPLITQQSASTTRTDSNRSESPDNNNTNKLRVKLEMERNLKKKGQISCEALVHNRRGRFIVLGSSGECLPVTRNPMKKDESMFSSCDSSEDEFHSAKTSLDDGSEDENYHKRYSIDLETPERRSSFAQRLKDALKHEISPSLSSSSDDSSYAVGINITGAGVTDKDIRVRRGGSTGFALQEDSVDEDYLEHSLKQERQWIDKFKSKQSALSRKESNKSSEYSFSTDFSSEQEELYEQFSHWLNNPILEVDKGTKRELDARDLAVVKFAGSILKRTLSESFAGIPVPLTENCDSSHQDFKTKKNKLILNAKSLSLELARQKHRLAAQLNDNIESAIRKIPKDLTCKVDASTKNLTKKRRAWFITCVSDAIVQTLEETTFNFALPQEEKLSELCQKPHNGLRAISTGNWGCGSSRKGDVQLKVIVQWLASSVAGVPSLIYYTYGHENLAKLDTVCRILVDRKWTVKDLAQATLRYSNQVLHGREVSGTLFEELIGG